MLGTGKIKTSRDNHVPICGIGASAGGVKALQALFREIPDDLGLAYVVILHLAPDHPSAMEEILASASPMQVHQVQDSPELKTNCVYVIAPDRELVIEGDQIKARPFSEARGSRAPIDLFFRSIAAGRSDGLAVILTGAGSDGALGAAAIKEAGGVIFVQDPGEAEFPSMPQSVISTGVADFIAPIAELAHRIIEVARSKEAVGSLDADRSASELRRILASLHARTGHDFSSYKRATVMRRVLRRMQVRRILTLVEYAALLQIEPEEASELFRDLLISVTQFFRDPDSFQILSKTVIEPLFDELGGEGLRCWVPGCATGEEAYSLAILICEEADRRKMSVPPVQIFATDLDQGALASAREGLFPRTIAVDVSDERLRRYFTEEGGQYRISKDIRGMIIFASHSVFKDPPFLRLDLISCRNLLIYLERPLQERLLALFCYSLKRQHYLFLGTAETADVAPDRFSLLDRQARLYRSSSQAMPLLPTLSQTFNPGFSSLGFTPKDSSPHRRDDHPSALHLAALEQTAPPSVLVDGHDRILHMSPSAGKYLEHPGGSFSDRLSSVVRPELRLDLGHAIDRALAEQLPTLTPAVPVAVSGETRSIAMNVAPVHSDDNAPSQALVFFLDAGRVEPVPDDGAAPETRNDEFRRMSAELKAAKVSLVRSRHDHEHAEEDLRTANYELQTINEEYRSTSEELETSKEELQSINEELQTVNAELTSKLDSISRAHNDLRNLTAATEIGTLFLDHDLRIRMFTAPTAALFNITEGDVGRPLTNFTNRIDYTGVEHDVRQVLRDLAPFEKQVKGSDGRWLMMRIRPYRTTDDRIEGVVVSFIDISSLLKVEQRLSESETRYRDLFTSVEKRYRALFDSIDQAFCVIEMIFDDDDKPIDYRFLEVNRAFFTHTGIAEPVGRTMREISPDNEQFWFDTYGRIAKTRVQEHFEGPAAAYGRFFETDAFPFGDPDTFQVGVLFQDITSRKQAELERELLSQELSHRVKNTLAVVQGLVNQTSRGMTSVEQFRTTFLARLQAFSHTHSLLLATRWQSADMHKLVDKALSAFDGGEDGPISITGPAVQLKPKQGLGLSLVLHELCTNAAKYGALSVPDGRLSLGWSLEQAKGGQFIRLRWQESGGPPVTLPGKKGFGTRLIERASTNELDGSARLEFDPAGLRAELLFPLS